MLVRLRKLGRLVLALSLISLVAVPAFAQGRDKGVFCSKHGNVGSCDGTAECDRLWADHVRTMHGGDGSGLDNVAAANLSPMGTPFQVVARGLIVGGGVGAMIGSFMARGDSATMAMPAALGGTGLFLTAGVIANRGAWGPISSGILGAAGGAGIGAAVGKAAEKGLEGSPELKNQQESTASSTAAGAAVGLATGFTLSLISRQQQWPVGQWFGPQGRARFIDGPRRYGVSIAW